MYDDEKLEAKKLRPASLDSNSTLDSVSVAHLSTISELPFVQAPEKKKTGKWAWAWSRSQNTGDTLEQPPRKRIGYCRKMRYYDRIWGVKVALRALLVILYGIGIGFIADVFSDPVLKNQYYRKHFGDFWYLRVALAMFIVGLLWELTALMVQLIRHKPLGNAAIEVSETIVLFFVFVVTMLGIGVMLEMAHFSLDKMSEVSRYYVGFYTEMPNGTWEFKTTTLDRRTATTSTKHAFQTATYSPSWDETKTTPTTTPLASATASGSQKIADRAVTTSTTRATTTTSSTEPSLTKQDSPDATTTIFRVCITGDFYFKSCADKDAFVNALMKNFHRRTAFNWFVFAALCTGLLVHPVLLSWSCCCCKARRPRRSLEEEVELEARAATPLPPDIQARANALAFEKEKKRLAAQLGKTSKNSA